MPTSGNKAQEASARTRASSATASKTPGSHWLCCHACPIIQSRVASFDCDDSTAASNTLPPRHAWQWHVPATSLWAMATGGDQEFLRLCVLDARRLSLVLRVLRSSLAQKQKRNEGTVDNDGSGRNETIVVATQHCPALRSLLCLVPSGRAVCNNAKWFWMHCYSRLQAGILGLLPQIELHALGLGTELVRAHRVEPTPRPTACTKTNSETIKNAKNRHISPITPEPRPPWAGPHIRNFLRIKLEANDDALNLRTKRSRQSFLSDNPGASERGYKCTSTNLRRFISRAIFNKLPSLTTSGHSTSLPSRD